MKRAVLLLGTLVPLLIIASCGSSNNSVTGPNGNVTVNAPSKLQNRAFITNQYSGNIQIMDSQNDTTAYYTVTNNNTGVTGPGVTGTAVNIPVGNSLTFAVLSPDGLETFVYDPSTVSFHFHHQFDGGHEWHCDHAKLCHHGAVFAGLDNDLRPGAECHHHRVRHHHQCDPRRGAGRQHAHRRQLTNLYPVPSARYVAISPNGQTLLVFASNADTMWLINTTATAPTAVAIPGFARPVNAFFSSDSNTAYVLNCGPECGSTAGPPSVMSFNIPSQTITATVPVGGASVGLLKSTTLYVAGYPGGNTGTFDVVDVSGMTRTTTNSIAIGDGTHTTMALSNNNKLYIGAATCINTTNGCLSIVDLGTTKAASAGSAAWAGDGNAVDPQSQHDVRDRGQRAEHLRHHHADSCNPRRSRFVARCTASSRSTRSAGQFIGNEAGRPIRPPVLFGAAAAIIAAEAADGAAPLDPRPRRENGSLNVRPW